MGRQILDSLYDARPTNAFKWAVSVERLDAATYAFLLKHAEELDVEILVTLLGKPLADDVEPHEERFVRRLAEVLPSAESSWLLEALALSKTMDPVAWADLTRRLKGRLPDWQWYRFVDKVRGGRIFTALSTGLHVPPSTPSSDREPPFVRSEEEGRAEPLVVPLLECPDNDIAATAYVLTLPMGTILDLNARLPDLVKLEDVRSVALCRVAAKDERWVPPLPAWMAPLVVQRLRHCEDDEALDLYTWFSEPGVPRQGSLLDIAVARFKLSPLRREWHSLVGNYLTSAKAWKTKGRAVIEFCAEYKGGFPPDLVTAALEGGASVDGATAKERRAAILRTMHDEAASVFVHRAREALKQADWDTGRRTLEALECLDPGRFIGGPIHHLRKIPNLPTDVLAHIDACEELAGVGGKDPSEAAFHEAFIALNGGLP